MIPVYVASGTAHARYASLLCCSVERRWRRRAPIEVAIRLSCLSGISDNHLDSFVPGPLQRMYHDRGSNEKMDLAPMEED